MIHELTWQEAEEKFKVRVDRRRVYATDGRQLFELSRWTEICSGCSVHGCTDTGCGCDECGYTGRRRRAVWSPYRVCTKFIFSRDLTDLCQGGPGTHNGKRWVRGNSCDLYVMSRRVPPIKILFPNRCRDDRSSSLEEVKADHFKRKL